MCLTQEDTLEQEANGYESEENGGTLRGGEKGRREEVLRKKRRRKSRGHPRETPRRRKVRSYYFYIDEKYEKILKKECYANHCFRISADYPEKDFVERFFSCYYKSANGISRRKPTKKFYIAQLNKKLRIKKRFKFEQHLKGFYEPPTSPGPEALPAPPFPPSSNSDGFPTWPDKTAMYSIKKLQNAAKKAAFIAWAIDR